MKKIFDLILVPLFVIIFLSILIVGQNNKIALIIAGWCMGMQTMPASAIVILTCSFLALSVFQKRNIAE